MTRSPLVRHLERGTQTTGRDHEKSNGFNNSGNAGLACRGGRLRSAGGAHRVVFTTGHGPAHPSGASPFFGTDGSIRRFEKNGAAV